MEPSRDGHPDFRDRIGPEWNHLSKRAKDMGRAAVLLSLALCAGVWVAAFAG